MRCYRPTIPLVYTDDRVSCARLASRVAVGQELCGGGCVLDERRSQWPRQDACNLPLDCVTGPRSAARPHHSTAGSRHSARLPAENQLAHGQPCQLYYAHGQVRLRAGNTSWAEQGLTSHQTHYRSYRERVLWVIRPNEQCQSTEGREVLRTRLQSH